MSDPKPDKFRALKDQLERDIELLAQLAAPPGNPEGLTPESAAEALREVMKYGSLREQVNFVRALKKLRGLPESFEGLSTKEAADVFEHAMRKMDPWRRHEFIKRLQEVVGPPPPEPVESIRSRVRRFASEAWSTSYQILTVSAVMGLAVALLIGAASLADGKGLDPAMLGAWGLGGFIVCLFVMLIGSVT